MKKVKYTPEIRDRAVQLLIESEKDYPSTWAAITAIAPKIGCTPETLRVWYLKHMDQLNPAKVQQISDQEKMKQMEREIKELKRANEILRKAAAFFAQAELDRPHKSWWILSITIKIDMVLKRFVEFYRLQLRPIIGL